MSNSTRAPAVKTCRPAAPGRAGKSSLLLIVVLTAVPAAVVLGALYLTNVRGVRQQAAKDHEEMMLRMTGLGAPVSNRLAARYADADGDLVADPPADPKQLVDPAELTFCYIATDDAAEYAKDWQPFVDHLSKVVGRPARYDASVTDVKGQLRALRDGRVQVTGFNTGSVPRAVNAAGFVPVAMLPTPDGSGLTRMRVIVPPDSPVRSPADLKGADLAFTDPASNSGFKAALVLLRGDFGLTPGRDFTWRYSGGHEASIAGVKQKRYPAAAVADDMLGLALAGGAVSPTDYRSVYESERFPTAGLGYAHNLAPALAARVREAIVTFDATGTPLARRLGNTLGGPGTAPATIPATAPATSPAPTPAGPPALKFVPANYKNDWPLIRRIDDAVGTQHALD